MSHHPSNDIFVLNCDEILKCHVSVHVWNHFSWKFEILQNANFTLFNVTNVIASDVDYDGKMDVVVVYDIGKIKLFIQSDDYTLSDSGFLIPGTKDQVLMLDANGDMRMDLFGSGMDEKPQFWLNGGHGFNQTKYLNTSSYLATPLNGGFVDIDGDCVADLVFLTNRSTIEIHLKRGREFVWDREIDVPSSIGQLTFHDLNRDGSIDILFADHTNNSIIIMYNQQIPYCSTLAPWNCRSFSNLCVSSPYSFVNHTLHLNKETEKMLGRKVDQFWIPYTIRVGDLFQSSYPDIILTLQDDKNVVRVEVWQNVALYDNIRTFKKIDQGVDALKLNTNPMIPFFFDLDESGTLSILTMNVDLSNGKKFMIATLNVFFLDGFFFKVLALNGVSSGFFRKDTFGVNMCGITTKITSTDLSGAKTALSNTQMSRTAYMALEAPYSYYGLGRTAGYVEEMFIGTPAGKLQMWSGLIPNSQLVVNPSSGDLEMYVSVSGAFLWVCLAFVITLGLLAIPIITFMIIEKRNDWRENVLKSSQMSNVFL